MQRFGPEGEPVLRKGRMSDAILVLNAGSSSIKFSLFLAQTDELKLLLGGQLEGLYTAPRFAARDAAGASLGKREWDKGTRLGHDGAVDHLIGFLREHGKAYRLGASGMNFSRLVTTSALTSVGSEYWSPPCTTRWPTAIKR